MHATTKKLKCHHCGFEKELIHKCPKCDNSDLRPLGTGTQKIEEVLKRLFPKKNWNKLHLQIIYYGREYCKARGCYGLSCKICTTCYPNRKIPFIAKKP